MCTGPLRRCPSRRFSRAVLVRRACSCTGPTLTAAASPRATTEPAVGLFRAAAGSRTPPMLLASSLSTFTSTRSPTGLTVLNCEMRGRAGAGAQSLGAQRALESLARRHRVQRRKLRSWPRQPSDHANWTSTPRLTCLGTAVAPHTTSRPRAGTAHRTAIWPPRRTSCLTGGCRLGNEQGRVSELADATGAVPSGLGTSARLQSPDCSESAEHARATHESHTGLPLARRRRGEPSSSEPERAPRASRDGGRADSASRRPAGASRPLHSTLAQCSCSWRGWRAG